MPIRAVVCVSSAGEELPATSWACPAGNWIRSWTDAARFSRNAGVTGGSSSMANASSNTRKGRKTDCRWRTAACWGASSHNGIVELQRGRVGQRRLPFWPMKWLSVEPVELKRLAHADWTRFNQRGVADDASATAMDLLVVLVEPYDIAA